MKIKLEQLRSAVNYKGNIEFSASLLAIANESYFVPSAVEVSCQEYKRRSDGVSLKAKCQACPLLNTNREDKQEIVLLPNKPNDAQMMVNLIQKSETIAKKAYHKRIGIPTPTKCREVEIEEIAQQSIRVALIETHLDEVRDGEQNIQSKMFFLGEDKIDITAKYVFEGTIVLDNETRQSITLAYNAKRTKDSIDSFKLEEHIEELKRFRPKDDSILGIARAIGRYCNYISNRVTHIRKRESIIFGADLAFHSVTRFHFNSRLLEKGWLETTVLGDTSTGKTETIRGIFRYYGLGEFISSGETASRAGLLGGIRTIGGQQVIEWGKIVKNDRGIVGIDETDNLSSKGQGSSSIMSELTDVRRSGTATITKTVSGSAPARTRIIWISNHPNGGHIDPGAEPVRVLPLLFGDQQDVARIDVPVLALKDDVSPDDINEPFPNDDDPVKGDGYYTKSACRARILFAWTRKPENIKISLDVERHINSRARSISDDFSLDIPLVADMKTKLARMSVSIAAMVFSTDETFENVIVKKHHADFAERFLRPTYSHYKYDVFSNRMKKSVVMATNADQILRSIFNYAHEIETILYADKITDHVISDAFNIALNDVGDKKEALKKAGAFREWKNGQRVKTPGFTQWLIQALKNKGRDYDFFKDKHEKRSENIFVETDNLKAER